MFDVICTDSSSSDQQTGSVIFLSYDRILFNGLVCFGPFGSSSHTPSNMV
jgi:hypothetical protein